MYPGGGVAMVGFACTRCCRPQSNPLWAHGMYTLMRLLPGDCQAIAPVAWVFRSCLALARWREATAAPRTRSVQTSPVFDINHASTLQPPPGCAAHVRSLTVPCRLPRAGPCRKAPTAGAFALGRFAGGSADGGARLLPTDKRQRKIRARCSHGRCSQPSQRLAKHQRRRKLSPQPEV